MVGWDEPLNVGSLSGVAPHHIPLALRDPLDGEFTTRRILVDAYGDKAIDPEAGGIIGWPRIRAVYRDGLGRELSDRQIRTIVHRAGYVVDVDGFPGTNVTSVWADCRTHEAAITEARRTAARTRWGAIETLVENVPVSVPAAGYIPHQTTQLQPTRRKKTLQ